MDEMIERVLIVCPDCDHDEVENDLNLTGDVERTINRALDGMLSPRQYSSFSASPKIINHVTIMDDDNDDDIIHNLPSISSFTSVKERTEPSLSNETNAADSICPSSTKLASEIIFSEKPKNTRTTGIKKPTESNTDGFLEISDSDSDSGHRRKKHTIPKSNASNLNAIPTLTTFSELNNEPFRVSSPESDSEFLPSAFGDNESNRYVSITSKRDLGTSGISILGKNTHTFTTGTSLGNGGSCTRRYDLCNEKSQEVDVNADSSGEPVKKKKRSKVEVEEQKKAALLKREAKEKEKEEKLDEKKRQKGARAAEQLQKKFQMEKKKLEKQAEKLTKSSEKLDGCIKFITACLDPSLVPDGTCEPAENLLLQKLTSLGANFKVEPQAYPSSITWRRTFVQHSVHKDDLQITSSKASSDENEVLVVLKAEQFAEMVFSFKEAYQSQQTGVQPEHKTLVDFTKDVKSHYHGKKVTFLLFGLEKYMRTLKTKQQRVFRSAALGTVEEANNNRKRSKKNTTPSVNVTRTDIEEALVDLQIKTNICVYPCETDEDIAAKVVAFTKAIAEKPYKKSLTDTVGFCLDRLDKSSLKISKDGKGMVKVWQQQIEQLRNVSREMAAAIVSEFSSPQLLLEAYTKCDTERKAMHLLEDILVRRGGGSLATSRRIGPELSKRVYILFHSKDSSQLMKI